MVEINFINKGANIMGAATEPKSNIIAETESYIAWMAEEPDGESTYHVEVNSVTLHFFEEEWNEYLELMRMTIERAD
jgi:hypothetical protein